MTTGTKYNVGNTFNSDGVDFKLVQFFWSNGNPSPNGFAEVFDKQRAGGSGKEIWTNNVNVEIVLASPAKYISFNAGHWGGNMNLGINGNLHNFGDVGSLNGTTINGVTITTTGTYNTLGKWEFKGAITSFYVGGQEFAIDNICVK